MFKKFGKILEICKQFAGNRINEKGNVARCGVAPTFSDLEVVALSLTAKVFGIDSENYLFNRLNDHFMMIRNNAKQPEGFFTRMAAKVAAFTMMQHFNFLNHKPIGQVEYALF